MAPRFRRLLLVLGLGLVFLPEAPRTDAQVPPHFQATVLGFTDTATSGLIFDHVREEGRFDSVDIQIEARRREAEPLQQRHISCLVAADPLTGIRFRTRHTTAEGRGFILTDHFLRGLGALSHPGDPGDDEDVSCEVRLWHADRRDEGIFHRVGTVADVEHSIQVRAERLSGVEVFEHRYCVRGQVMSKPGHIPGEDPPFQRSRVEGVVTEGDCGSPNRILGDDPIHG